MLSAECTSLWSDFSRPKMLVCPPGFGQEGILQPAISEGSSGGPPPIRGRGSLMAEVAKDTSTGVGCCSMLR